MWQGLIYFASFRSRITCPWGSSNGVSLSRTGCLATLCGLCTSRSELGGEEMEWNEGFVAATRVGRKKNAPVHAPVYHETLINCSAPSPPP